MLNFNNKELKIGANNIQWNKSNYQGSCQVPFEPVLVVLPFETLAKTKTQVRFAQIV